jgi:hypothetical protein
MKRAPNQPTSDLTLFAGIFAKLYTVPDANTLLPQHAHRHSHLTLVISGTVEAWADDEPLGKFEAPAFIKIEALVKHRFLTCTSGVQLACIHASDAVDDDALIHERHDLITEET